MDRILLLLFGNMTNRFHEEGDKITRDSDSKPNMWDEKYNQNTIREWLTVMSWCGSTISLHVAICYWTKCYTYDQHSDEKNEV